MYATPFELCKHHPILVVENYCKIEKDCMILSDKELFPFKKDSKVYQIKFVYPAGNFDVWNFDAHRSNISVVDVYKFESEEVALKTRDEQFSIIMGNIARGTDRL